MGEAPDLARLTDDFQRLGGDPKPIASKASTSGHEEAGQPRVPDWMRAGSASPVAASPQRRSTKLSSGQSQQGWQGIPADCAYDPYRPKGLKREIEERRARYYPLMVTTACHVGVPTTLFDALITQESGYNPYARSMKGAIGMAQLMPATARAAGIANPWDVAANLRGGAQILKSHLAEFGRYDLALAAYNAGAGRVRQIRRVPRIRETVTYVSSILTDVRRQYVRAIGLSGYAGVTPASIRTASLLRF
jgi:soluble lytic murein transglycosylase-like protein